MDTLNAIHFSPISPERFIRDAAVQVTSNDITVGNSHVPVDGGLFDPRMGTVDPRYPCATCSLNTDKCPGHFGYYIPCTRVYVPHYLPIITRILSNTCSTCNQYNASGTCQACDDGGNFTRYRSLDRITISGLSADKCYDALSAIQGPPIKDPQNLVWSIIPIGPPCIRPTAFQIGGIRAEADLTHIYADIIRADKALRDNISRGKDEGILAGYRENLQTHVALMMDNTRQTGITLSNRSRAYQCFKSKITPKYGRIRGNLMGKRVDYSSRSVITPDPMIGIGELGVPVDVAKVLTVQETVNRYNHAALQRAVNEEKASYIMRGDKIYQLEIIYRQRAKGADMQGTLTLIEGDLVDRHLQDGDYVLFNRQPSLHKMSMMAHTARILPGKTFRMNPNTCTPYNADFDGDEMNMHVPRSPETIIELKHLVAVPHQIVSPQASRPVIGLIQDALLGCQEMTRPDVHIDRHEAMNILANTPGAPTYDVGPEGISGRDLLSMFLPPDLNYTKPPVVIRRGRLIEGILSKAHMGVAVNSIIHVLWLDYGPAVAAQFIDSVQAAVNHWLVGRGISVGLSDAIADMGTVLKMNTIVETSFTEVQTPDMSEADIINTLNATRNQTGSLASRNILSNNRINAMVTAGSKGSVLNISQVMANVGQQIVTGRDGRSGRADDHFYGRPLPHIAVGDNGPRARGYVQNSYLQGLDPVEFFYHAMSGREGLIDTAVKTSSTGYLQRQLVKTMEDLVIDYDGMVRDGQGRVIQVLYGGDGLNPCYLEKGRVPFSIDRILAGITPSGPPATMLTIDTAIIPTGSRAYRVLEDARNTLQALGDAGLHVAMNQVYAKYRRARIDAGEMVGTIAAQSIGESLTQLTLNTFHSAGISSKTKITSGVGRFTELIGVPKKYSPDRTITMAGVGAEPATTIHDFATDFTVTFGMPPGRITWPGDSKLPPWVIRMGLNEAVMHATGITEPYRVAIAAVGARGVKHVEVELGGNAVLLWADSYDDAVAATYSVLAMRVSGNAAGTLMDALQIDPHAVSSCPREMYDLFGIEAARESLLVEFRVLLDANGISIDMRHLELLVDVMTFTSDPCGANRHGAVKRGTGVLARATFEEPIKHLANAAAGQVTDKLGEISPNIMLAQLGRLGTGVSDVVSR
jgi:DNA-directed RNA polymerase subunit A'